jgi:ubiquinone/menaquinone biosynthesis C-methylase UbiE
MNEPAVAAASARRLARRRGEYGVDAPYVPLFLGGVGCALLCFAALSAWVIGSAVGAVVCLVYGLFMLLSMASYLYTTRAGKFRVWSELLAQLGLHGSEQVLDLGCGRGTVLLMAAALLPAGQAVGVDLWKTSDQSGNALAVTRRNAEREGVAARVALHTADMRALPFPDASFDLVLSSLAIHNISAQAGRLQAIDEAVRVLKPGGRLLIADFRSTDRYAERLRHLGMTSVAQRGLGWRFWYGGPWAVTSLVSAVKPA